MEVIHIILCQALSSDFQKGLKDYVYKSQTSGGMSMATRLKCTMIILFKNTGTRRGTGSHATGVFISWHEITGSVDMPPSPIHFNQPTGPTSGLPPSAAPIQFYEKLVDDTVI